MLEIKTDSFSEGKVLLEQRNEQKAIRREVYTELVCKLAHMGAHRQELIQCKIFYYN